MGNKDEEACIGEPIHIEYATKDSSIPMTRGDMETMLGQLAQLKSEPRQFGNPVPLGLGSFGLTVFMFGLCCVQASGVESQQIVNSVCFFYGGVAQFMAGMWSFACGNTFAGVAFTSYGPFWICYAAFTTKAFGIHDSYAGNEEMYSRAVAFYLFAWFIFTFVCFLCLLRTTVSMVLLFGLVLITFLLLAVGYYTGNVPTQNAGGYFAIILAFVAWYNAFGMMRSDENTMVPFYDAKMPW